MRRIPALALNRLGRIPDRIEDTDYTVKRPAPAAVIGADGRYIPGWYDGPPGRTNLDDASGPRISRQGWIYIHFDTPRQFVVANVADLNVAGNLALLVVDKETGRFDEAGHTPLLFANGLRVAPDGSRIEDAHSGSFIHMNLDGSVEFSVHAEGMSFTGRARPRFPEAFHHCIRYHRGHGTLQWWQGLELEEGLLVRDGHVEVLPPGTPGVVDRTVGHRPALQAWNWLAVAGEARGPNGPVPYSLQVSRDRPEDARPWVDGRKAVAWIDGPPRKLGDVRFEYDKTRPMEGPWRIRGGDLDLSFTPRFDRHEHKPFVVIHGDFHQYYGEISGTIRQDGDLYEIAGDFAVVEDSLLQL